MCEDDLPRIEDLPRRSTTDIKVKFSDVMKELRAKNVVAITQRGVVEAILIDAAAYRIRTRPFGADVDLAELTAEFDRRLASLQSSDARERLDAVMKARGKTKRRPKAGEY